MKDYSPTFLLRVAHSIVEEVAKNTDQVLETAMQLRNRQGFFDSLKGSIAAGGLIFELNDNLSKAILLSQKASQLDDDVKLESSDTPASVIARALFQKGLISFGQKNFKDAINHFNSSSEISNDQKTHLNIGLCYLQMKSTFSNKNAEAVEAFIKCIEIKADSEIAIMAGKELARLDKL